MRQPPPILMFVQPGWRIPSPAPFVASGLNAPVLSVIYPGTAERRKRRQFFYELDRLVRVETVNGDDSVIFERDPLTGAWFMVADGIKARMPGAVRVSSDGILHVQTDRRGLCREEHPDGNVSINESCEECATGDIGMLSMVGHDLRSPLMSVQGLLTLLSSGALGDLRKGSSQDTWSGNRSEPLDSSDQ